MNFVMWLHHLDQHLTLALNSLHCPFTDAVWVLFSDKKVWYIMYAALAVLLFVRAGWKKALLVLLSVALTVLACDQFANLVKDSVARLRPVLQDSMIQYARKLHSLIKSDGGTGPVKSGNLHLQGANSCSFS